MQLKEMLLTKEILIELLKNRDSINDSSFDDIYPERIRGLSASHWSPILAALKAAKLATEKPSSRVLDLGSGAGKFCMIGALTTDGFFVGVEQREYLVELSKSISRKLRVPRAEFICSNITEYDWTDFDSIYIYNPFSENLDPKIKIDDLCALDASLYVKYIKMVQTKLNALSPGKRIITLNGFGGDFPPEYRLTYREEFNKMPLEVWIK